MGREDAMLKGVFTAWNANLCVTLSEPLDAVLSGIELIAPPVECYMP
jgi:hypothetical protein